jgi:hypothetical protein
MWRFIKSVLLGFLIATFLIVAYEGYNAMTWKAPSLPVQQERSVVQYSGEMPRPLTQSLSETYNMSAATQCVVDIGGSK